MGEEVFFHAAFCFICLVSYYLFVRVVGVITVHMPVNFGFV